ncbi:two pore domain potassium channel family protein [Salibacterium aidingense]|uniref:two pore domain potassium channel family protein n=1 Tax=Salibacterium aidingense TaxID=384933 RepID=UPI0004084AE6|nr:two pore domain potassium channel family protein [Salibacterium aidingense]
MSTENDRSTLDITYEIMMVLLAALSVGTLWYDTGVDNYLIWGTWGVFFVDFLYRFFTTENKWQFIKSNPFLVIAVIPLDAVFQFARFARILHLLRLKTITKYYTMPFIRFLKQQHLGVVVSLAFVFLFFTIIPLYYLEPELTSYWDAFSSSLLSLIFFGRSDFEPVTALGRFLLVLLSIVGVILYGLAISTAFDVIYQSRKMQNWLKKVRDKGKKNSNH